MLQPVCYSVHLLQWFRHATKKDRTYFSMSSMAVRYECWQMIYRCKVFISSSVRPMNIYSISSDVKSTSSYSLPAASWKTKRFRSLAIRFMWRLLPEFLSRNNCSIISLTGNPFLFSTSLFYLTLFSQLRFLAFSIMTSISANLFADFFTIRYFRTRIIFSFSFLSSVAFKPILSRPCSISFSIYYCYPVLGVLKLYSLPSDFS
jgi:hypothetical protein